MQKDSVSQFKHGTKGIALCADDFGADPAINAAIVELGSAGRLSATSVLVDGSHVQSEVPALAGLALDVGLHLNLTEQVGELAHSDVMSLNTLIMRSHLGGLDPRWVKDSIDRQLDRFEAAFARAPDYVDGHLHVHQLPVVRDALLQALSDRYPKKPLWLRDTRALPGIGRGWSLIDRFKTWVIGHLGMAQLARAARARAIPCNHGFAGVYDFTRPHPPFLEMMQRWLSCSAAGTLIMTHPATAVIPGDPIGAARVAEYEGLASEAFVDLLNQHGLRLVRLSQAKSSLP